MGIYLAIHRHHPHLLLPHHGGKFTSEVLNTVFLFKCTPYAIESGQHFKKLFLDEKSMEIEFDLCLTNGQSK
jgi:hypothetical protein